MILSIILVASSDSFARGGDGEGPTDMRVRATDSSAASNFVGCPVDDGELVKILGEARTESKVRLFHVRYGILTGYMKACYVHESAMPIE